MSRISKRSAEDELSEDPDSRGASLSDDPSSTPPSSSRKRRRISNDSLGEAGPAEREDTPLSDIDFEDDEDDDIAATQAIQQKRAQQGTNEPAECGILVNVELFNFMCHEHMIYELGPLINFICGKNGSGKSAILTAIVICLGGKASSTNRGQSLKSFIKEGRDSSRIICRIKNKGENAYLPEEYGDIIEIERYFSKQGSSGFKIKSDKGRTVSTKKMDLEEICDHFGLQIDNPLNVLSQDMARQFLSDSNASEKYKFFVKGVQLEQLDQDYRLIEEQLDNIEVNIDKKKPDIQILERNMLKAKQRDDAMKKKDQVRERLRELRSQIAWVQVEEQEHLLDDLKKSVEEANSKIADAEVHAEVLDQNFQASTLANETAHEALSQAQQALQEAEDEKKERVVRRDEAMKGVADAQGELRAIRDALKLVESEIKKNEDGMKQEQNRLAEIQGGGATDRLQHLTEARGELIQAQEAETAAREQMQSFREAADETKNNKAEKAEAVDDKQQDLAKAEANLGDIMRDGNSVEAIFGSEITALLRVVQQERQRFRTMPVGPLGVHVRLLKPEWSSVIETAIGSALSGFIVTSKQDGDVLAGLMKRVNYHGPVLHVNTIPLQNIAENEPDQSFDTILRVLDIDNELIKKQLIIQNGIEQLILIRDLDEASHRMYDSGRLHNVRRCFCFNPNNKRGGFTLSYTRSGEPSQDPLKPYFGRPRMKTDNEAQIQTRREAVQECKDQLHQAQTEFYQARDAAVKASQAVERNKRDLNALVIKRQEWEDRISELVDATVSDQVDEAPLRALEQGLAAAKAQKNIHAESYKDAVNSSDEKKARLSETQAEIQAWEANVRQAEKGQQQAQHAVTKADNKRSDDLGQKNEAFKNLDKSRKNRDELDGKRLTQETTIEDYIAQAMEISQRISIPEGKDRNSLMTEHGELRRDLDKYRQQMGGTEEEIAQAYVAARDAFKTGKRDLLHLENVATKLKSSLQERRERWKKFRSLITVRARAQFTYLLSERSFRGKLIADHKQKLLELRVEPDITKRDGQGRNTRTLSGGEKSFSQICLLLAIWEAMGSPIRCLDEFDVFMDPVNRNLSVNLLIEAARQSVGRQFILISPGTKNDIQRASDIRAKEIAAPERGQRTLAFPISV